MFACVKNKQGLGDDGESNSLEMGGSSAAMAGKAPELTTAMNPMQDVGFDDDTFDVDEVHTPGQNEDDDEKDSDEDDDSDKEGEEEDEDAPLVKKPKEKKAKKPENIVDVLRELAGLPIAHDDAHWFDLGVMDVEDGQFSTNGQLYISVRKEKKKESETPLKN